MLWLISIEMGGVVAASFVKTTGLLALEGVLSFDELIQPPPGHNLPLVGGFLWLLSVLLRIVYIILRLPTTEFLLAFFLPRPLASSISITLGVGILIYILYTMYTVGKGLFSRL
ncbi:MAG: hypothetical protein KIH01_08675 [Candidatus Freyarchaeota archaeon]|nr:hypothetical protein [Candidatus Jordarchaeia archaeon]